MNLKNRIEMQFTLSLTFLVFVSIIYLVFSGIGTDVEYLFSRFVLMAIAHFVTVICVVVTYVAFHLFKGKFDIPVFPSMTMKQVDSMKWSHIIYDATIDFQDVYYLCVIGSIITLLVYPPLAPYFFLAPFLFIGLSHVAMLPFKWIENSIEQSRKR